MSPPPYNVLLGPGVLLVDALVVTMAGLVPLAVVDGMRGGAGEVEKR